MQNTQVIIEKWRPLIQRVATRYCNKIASYEDLCSEGVLAILEALVYYGEEKNVYTCIMNKIKIAAIESSYAIHIPSGSIMSPNVAVEINRKTRKMEDEDVKYIRDLHSYIDINEIVDKNDKKGIVRQYLLEGIPIEVVAKNAKVSKSTIYRTTRKVREKVMEYMEG